MRWRGALAFALVTVLLLPAGPAAAAEREPDEMELWADAGVRLPLFSRTTATLTQYLRWDESGARFYLAAPELAVRYRAWTWWHLEGGYRYLYERDNDGVFQDRHRIFANTRFRAKTAPLALELRFQWQEEFRQEEDDGTPRRQYLRTRAKAKVRGLGSIEPYISLEAYQRIDGADEDVPAGTLSKLRGVIGAQWEQGAVDFDLSYKLVVPIDDEQDPLRHVVSFGVRYDLVR